MIAFARTIRALDADDFRGSNLGFLFAIILIAAWTWWILTPSVPQYDVLAENVTLNWPVPHRAAINNLPRDAFGRIQPGQATQLRFEGQTVGAKVLDRSLFMTPYETRLVILDVPSTIHPPLPTQATIEIETGRVSPATIALRALSR